MTIWRLVMREIVRRKLSFTLGVVSVIIAVGVLVAELTLLDAHDLHTQSILEKKETETREDMRRMEDDYRIIMKDMGFNLLILPKDQTLGTYYADGYVSRDMPEEYVRRLAESDIVTIRHLLPSLEQKIQWPERDNRAIILTGTRGEVPFLHGDPMKPILEAVPPGAAVMGYELWTSLGLKTGDKIKLLGREFEVGDCHAERGTKDDITIWIDLATAQELLGKPGRINGILALKCLCAGNDIVSIRREVAELLPETKVIEFESMVLARARARDRAKATADSASAVEKQYRAKLRGEREAFASWLVPLVILGCTAWIGLLAFTNVRERKTEIGILRALGLRSGQILSVFLIKALVIGFSGAVIGYIAGYIVGLAADGGVTGISTAVRLFSPEMFLIVLAAAPVLAAGASWIPALLAAQQDPAEILREG